MFGVFSASRVVSLRPRVVREWAGVSPRESELLRALEGKILTYPFYPYFYGRVGGKVECSVGGNVGVTTRRFGFDARVFGAICGVDAIGGGGPSVWRWRELV